MKQREAVRRSDGEYRPTRMLLDLVQVYCISFLVVSSSSALQEPSTDTRNCGGLDTYVISI